MDENISQESTNRTISLPESMFTISPKINQKRRLYLQIFSAK